MHIWLLADEGSSRSKLTAIKAALTPFLSPSELSRLSSTKNLRKKTEFFFSRFLIRNALNYHFENQKWEFTERKNSCPLITPIPANMFYSISHCAGLYGFAFSTAPVGIDIENVSVQRSFVKLAQSTMDDKELTQFNKQKPENVKRHFYRIWTLKEACYKALSEHDQKKHTIQSISIENMLKIGKFSFYHTEMDKFSIAIASREVRLRLFNIHLIYCS